MSGAILIILGILIIIFSQPKFRAPLMARMFNEGFVTPKILKPDESEIVKNTGPQTSLLFIGIIFILLGFIISVWT